MFLKMSEPAYIDLHLHSLSLFFLLFLLSKAQKKCIMPHFLTWENHFIYCDNQSKVFPSFLTHMEWLFNMFPRYPLSGNKDKDLLCD